MSSIPSVRTLQTTKTMSLYKTLQPLWPIHVSSIRSIFNPESYKFPVYLLPLSVEVSSQGFSLTHTHTKTAIVNTRQSSAAQNCCKSKAEALRSHQLQANVQPVLCTKAAWHKSTLSHWEISSQIQPKGSLPYCWRFSSLTTKRHGIDPNGLHIKDIKVYVILCILLELQRNKAVGNTNRLA